MTLHNEHSGAILASPKAAIRRATLAVLVFITSICNPARANAIDEVMCAKVGEIARYIASRRDAGVPETRVRQGATKAFAGPALLGVLNVVHIIYNEPSVRYLAPDKTFELFRATCMAPYSVASTDSVGDIAHIG